MLIKTSKNDDDDFVIGNHYLVTFSLFQTSEDFRTAILLCQGYSSNGPVLVDVATGEEHQVSAKSLYMKCDMTAENMPVTTGRDLLIAHVIKYSIGYGELWREYFTNKYGECTSLSPRRDLGLRFVLKLNGQPIFDNQLSSILYGVELEGNGKYSIESNTDFDPPPLTKEEKFNEMINIISNCIRLRWVVNVRVSQNNETVNILSDRNSYRFYSNELRKACEYAIKQLSLQPGVYYPKEP